MIEIKLIIPSVPNFIFCEGEKTTKENGLRERPKVAIGDLDNTKIDQIAEEWKAALYVVANRQRRLKHEDTVR